jgi:hypothetical protein
MALPNFLYPNESPTLTVWPIDANTPPVEDSLTAPVLGITSRMKPFGDPDVKLSNAHISITSPAVGSVLIVKYSSKPEFGTVMTLYPSALQLLATLAVAAFDWIAKLRLSPAEGPVQLLPRVAELALENVSRIPVVGKATTRD